MDVRKQHFEELRPKINYANSNPAFYQQIGSDPDTKQKNDVYNKKCVNSGVEGKGSKFGSRLFSESEPGYGYGSRFKF
jgi:hypothetical protein